MRPSEINNLFQIVCILQTRSKMDQMSITSQSHDSLDKDNWHISENATVVAEVIYSIQFWYVTFYLQAHKLHDHI